MIAKPAGTVTLIVDEVAAGSQHEPIVPPAQVTVGPVTIGSMVTGKTLLGSFNQYAGTIISKNIFRSLHLTNDKFQLEKNSCNALNPYWNHKNRCSESCLFFFFCVINN